MSSFSAMMVTSMAFSISSIFYSDFGFNIFAFMIMAIAFIVLRYANGS